MEKKILIKGEFVANLFWRDSISVCSDWGCNVTLQDNPKSRALLKNTAPPPQEKGCSSKS